MLTRSEIESEYTVENGIIRSPGQFEGEAIYIPHFWAIAMEGFADRDDGIVYGFDISAEDRAQFPEIPKRKRTIRIYQRDDGFVCEC